MRIVSYLIFIFFAPALIFINFNFLVFNHGFYKSQFEKLNVYETFGSQEVVDNQSKDLIDYLCCGKELDEHFFGERERLHLLDVRKIITFIQAMTVLICAFILAGLLFLVLKSDAYEFAKTILGASVIAALALVILWISAFLNFEWFFLKFHYVTFDNDLWQLPESSNLIKLFSQQFFVNFANRIAIQTLIISAGLFLASYYFLKRHDFKKH